LPLNEKGKIAVGQAVGTDGFLNIIKENEYTKQSYNGLVPLVSGEIAEDFTEYFAKSQQKPTVLALGVLVDKNGVRRSGGYMIQLMPDATENEISKIEKAVENAQSVSKMLDQGMSLEEMVRTVTGDENALFLINDLSIEFKCDCSKERFADGLAAIGKNELESIIKEDGKANTKCHFCNKEYNFSKEELEEISKNSGETYEEI
jgi:molecular chaperone Hsp33